jgi:hypothetical protein
MAKTAMTDEPRMGWAPNNCITALNIHAPCTTATGSAIHSREWERVSTAREFWDCAATRIFERASSPAPVP